MALRGVGRISQETREKVIAAAEEAGYRVSPVLSRAFRLARQSEQSHYRETIALICEYPMVKAPLFQQTIFDHAVERGESLGYKIDAFELSGDPKAHRRMSRILETRGIRGLIILPRLEHTYPRLHLNWNKFAAVEIGRTLWSPQDLHRVQRSVYPEVLNSVHILKRAGYRRIGLVVEPMAERQRQKVYTAAFQVAQEHIPQKSRLPPLTQYGSWSPEVFERWHEQFSPDVIMIHSNSIVPGWLHSMGLKIPTDISVFGFNVAGSNISGITSNTALFGGNAVELLSILLERDHLGTSEAPYNWLVKSKWQKGETLLREIQFPPPFERLNSADVVK